MIIAFLFKTLSFSMIGSFRSSIIATSRSFLLTLRRLDKEVAFVSALPRLFNVSFVELRRVDIPGAVECCQDRVPILSLLPTRRRTFRPLGFSWQSR